MALLDLSQESFVLRTCALNALEALGEARGGALHQLYARLVVVDLLAQLALFGLISNESFLIVFFRISKELAS